MSKMIFVNLPVADLPAAKAFYEAIGATNDPRFTDDTAAAMGLSDVIHVMLLTHDKFSQFTPKRIADAHATSEVLICISADSRESVDDDQVAMSPGHGYDLRGKSHLIITEKALAAGGREPREKQDYGFMYSRSFEDLDGHIWEPMWMDVAGFEAATQQAEPA